MFLKQDNKIKWKLLGFSSLFVLIITLLGIFYFDKSVYLFFRGFDFSLWKIFDAVFDGKVWLFASGIVLLLFYIKKSIQDKTGVLKYLKRLNLKCLLSDFLQKTKNSNAFYIFCSILTAGVIVKVLKFIIGRARPIFFEALDMTGFFPFSAEWAFNSMPSGHTAVSFAALVMFGLLEPKYKPFTWTLAIVIGVSRICIGAHWPTDVILAAFIGMVVADLVKSFLKSGRIEKFC